ncbi:energy-coupling factor ABC transporter permease [Myxococcota bacterium]|nr:energy-coupling factor ABC transporter permease [Myxococcota bacterium]MBU1429894.1 energy-coupling factor ABC transporter permease [Myxococcota bacterium]MBU1896135.1 energy-coupling factor ABC transporter permease [Myxococcota bacterium]
MHMADALTSPLVGGGLWAVAAGSVALSARRLQRQSRLEDEPNAHTTALMGVLGAFVFAAQMINFPIPGTGASGHLAGGVLLVALLGPAAALLVMASVLFVQALIFADGGLLAYGANLFNLGVIPATLGYALLRLLAARPRLAAFSAALVCVLLGASAVAFEVALSGVSALPLAHFWPLMLGIHLPLGVVEGLITAGALMAAAERRPSLRPQPLPPTTLRRFIIAALLLAGGVSLLASSAPDGLEWALARLSMSLPEAEGGLMADYALPFGGVAGQIAARVLGVLLFLSALGLSLARKARRTS